MKRLFDLLLALLALVLLSPLLLGVAVAVALHDGMPVLFRQQRVGRGGRVFEMLKFRSMVRHAESAGPYFTAAGDARITPVGRFIRRTSLDELPQLFNVLKGDMSLVGPRPDLPAQRALYTDAQWRARCSVRPGITGLAQVQIRSEGTQEERVALDLHYASQAKGLGGLWLDITIMARTVGRLSGRGAN